MVPLPLNQVLCGDCREVMTGFPADSIDLVVTSPPYWGLRDYGGDNQVWGGDPNCDHDFTDEIILQRGNRDMGFNERWGNSPGLKKQEKKNVITSHRGMCAKCGAWRGGLGLEPHPQMFVDHLVEVSREINRVLKPRGSFWLNLGDTYASMKGKCYNAGGGKASLPQKAYKKLIRDENPSRMLKNDGKWLQPKQLLGIPWRVAVALQEDGWILRNCVVWYKRNHMPESVTDRLTKSYEFVFFLVKHPRYYFNLDAIREPYSEVSIQRLTQPTIMQQMGGDKQQELYGGAPGHGNRPADILKGLASKYAMREDSDALGEPRARAGKREVSEGHPNGKNPGDVWDIPTQPFPGAHFAVFPMDLIEPIIKAASPKNGTILDPFAGSGTALRVARKLGRGFIGIEINSKYAAMCERRIRSDSYTNPPEGVASLNEVFEN